MSKVIFDMGARSPRSKDLDLDLVFTPINPPTGITLTWPDLTLLFKSKRLRVERRTDKRH